MANKTFYFFFAPTWDYPPDGPIKIGNVLTSLKKPERPLYTAVPQAGDDVFSSEKRQVEFSREKLLSGQFSIMTRFLSFLGAGVDVGVNWDKSDAEIYNFERIETVQFFPKQDYLQGCIEAEPVRRYLDKSRYKKPVYVITGLKTVRGAMAKSYKSRAVGGAFGAEVDGALWSGGSGPVRVGPDVEGNMEQRNGVSWEGSSDFVFAFRVRKIFVKKTGRVKSDEDYKTGAMFERESATNEVPRLSILTEEDPDAEDEDFVPEELTEDGLVFRCAVPPLLRLEEDRG
ncbi:hypothetical protein GGR52DRAFT_2605 [Hypoxylon sp. FL1284]|nr:hypothetical protein GGR52DRAFT_2605 [Hypoxylon sp. FL1284]